MTVALPWPVLFVLGIPAAGGLRHERKVFTIEVVFASCVARIFAALLSAANEDCVLPAAAAHRRSVLESGGEDAVMSAPSTFGAASYTIATSSGAITATYTTATARLAL